jgi:hypothetical protein
MYIVLKQFIPGNDQIWVAKLDANDPEYIYPTEQEAIDKAAELQAADPTGRQYKAAPYGENVV